MTVHHDLAVGLNGECRGEIPNAVLHGHIALTFVDELSLVVVPVVVCLAVIG